MRYGLLKQWGQRNGEDYTGWTNGTAAVGNGAIAVAVSAAYKRKIALYGGDELAAAVSSAG